MSENNKSKDKIILIVLSIFACSFVALLVFLQKNNDHIDGVYTCTEISDSTTKDILPLLKLKLELNDNHAKLFNFETKVTVFEGAYSVKTPPRNDVFKDTEQINIQIKDQVFSPMMHYYEDKIYYLDNTTDKNKYIHYIFVKE
jgi:murein L,D-transpeptidase YafK